MQKVFISHAIEDRPFVEREVVPLLRTHGIYTWMAETEIITASQWEESIRLGLEMSDWFLVVMSPSALMSRWVKAELAWAVEERKDHIIPLLATDCDWKKLHLMMRAIQIIDFRTSQGNRRQKLLAVFGIESRAFVDNEEPYYVGKLMGRITNVSSEGAYNTFWVSTEKQSLEFFAEFLNQVDVSNKNVDYGHLVSRFLRETAADEYPQICFLCMDYEEVSACFVLESGNVVLAHSSYVRDKDLKGFTYARTGAPAHPCFGATHGYKSDVVLAYEDGAMYVFRNRDGIGRYIKGKQNGIVNAVEFSHRSLMVSATDTGEIEIWSMPKYELQKRINASIYSIQSLCVNKASGRRVFATGDSKGQVKVFTYDGKCIKTVQHCNDSIVALDFFGNDYLASGTDNKVYLWNFNEADQPFVIDIEKSQITKLSVLYPIDNLSLGATPGHGLLVAGSNDGSILAWDIRL